MQKMTDYLWRNEGGNSGPVVGMGVGLVARPGEQLGRVAVSVTAKHKMDCGKYEVVDGVFAVKAADQILSEQESAEFDQLRIDIRNAINEVTEDNIVHGFMYPDSSGQRVRLNRDDQFNFATLWQRRDIISYPYTIKTWPDGLRQETMVMNDAAELDTFYQAGVAYIEATIFTGIALKQQAYALNLNGLREWVDPRL